MSARISRKRAAMTVAAFALIVAAWTSLGAQRSMACTIDPCSNDPVVVCDYYTTSGCSDGQSVATGTAVGIGNDTVVDALGTVDGALSGYGACATASLCGPAATGIPGAEVGGTYVDVTGQPLQSSAACNATRTSLPVVGSPCDNNNKYNCYDDYVYLKRDYTSSVYWHWQTHLQWCGYSMGRLTSRSYDDHNVLATGFQCSVLSQDRVPVEKIDGGHWQQHSNFAFRCKVSGAFKDDHIQEGAHYWNNGAYKEIAKGN